MKITLKKEYIVVAIIAIIFTLIIADKKLITGSLKEQQTIVQDNTGKITNLYNKLLTTLPAHDVYCIPSKKSYCSLEGCKEVEPNVFILLGKTSKVDGLFMARCDNKPCDVYDANLVTSGAFASFETKEPHGILFKMSTLDKSFTEVVTMGTDSFVSNGYCYTK